MKQLSLKNLRTTHFGLLLTVVFLFAYLRLTLDSEDSLLKVISLCTSLIGSLWAVILILITLTKDNNDPEQKVLFSYYRNLLTNTRFLVISNLAFLMVALGLLTFLAVYQVVEFHTREFEVEVFLTDNEPALQGPGYKSLGITTPAKPLKVRLPAGEKRFSFESLSEEKIKDAQLIYLRPFSMGKPYVYQVNMQ
jgi:hypothetical protein